jgi:hypothetical protein
MLVDRAGGPLRHQGTVPEHMRFLPQLPGSPARNPAEPRWDDLRAQEPANHDLDTLALRATALCEGINRLAAEPERLRSMTKFPYMQVRL